MSYYSYLIFMIVMLVMISLVFGTEVDKRIPYHPLFQISKSDEDLTSVDKNKDGIIDHTNADIKEILSNGNVADIDLIIENAKVKTDYLEVVEDAEINKATIEDAFITTGKISTLEVLSDINTQSISSGSGVFNTLSTDELYVVGNTDLAEMSADKISTNSLCLRLKEGSTEYVCINNWEDLLDILYVRLG